MFWTRYLPLISFSIATCALTFQTMVLYPWHIELDEQFKHMKADKLRKEQEMKQYNQKKMNRIYSMEKKIQYLILREEEEAAALKL